MQQLVVVSATLITFVLSALLAFYLTKGYRKTKQKSHLFWSAGMWVFAVTVLMEVFFALNIYNSQLFGLYFFLVAVLVQLLSLGSVQLVKSVNVKKLYYAFTIIATLALVYSVATSSFSNELTNYVVTGVPPFSVLVVSSIATFISSIVIVAVAIIGYRKTRRAKLLSIIAGVVVVAVAGTLYIASFPVFLYLAEFVGIVLLWIGFADFKKPVR